MKYGLNDLLNIMERLRAPDGCPWDRKQTHQSLRQYLIEETYELIDEIDRKDMGKMCEELGDLLLQIVFHAQLAKEKGYFDMEDVTDTICKKMISRHTHVFGDEIAETPEEVLKNWDRNKKEEKGQQLHAEALNDVPKELPALSKSMKIQQKAARVGFDWDDIDDVYKKLFEEIKEVREAAASRDAEKIEDEIGDMLFAAVNVARFNGIHPEIALNKAAAKFVRRFALMEQKAVREGKSIENMELRDLDILWNEVKEDERNAD